MRTNCHVLFVLIVFVALEGVAFSQTATIQTLNPKVNQVAGTIYINNTDGLSVQPNVLLGNPTNRKITFTTEYWFDGEIHEIISTEVAANDVDTLVFTESETAGAPDLRLFSISITWGAEGESTDGCVFQRQVGGGGPGIEE